MYHHRLPDFSWPPTPASTLTKISLPLVGRLVHAGFPSPADDFIEHTIDLNEVLIHNPISTFLWRVVGDCMVEAMIFEGDVVVVDRSLSPVNGAVVLAIVDGEPTLKRLALRDGMQTLLNENRTMPAFVIADGIEVSIWGVVTATIRELTR